MTTYNLTVNTSYLNGRSAPNGTINFPAGATLSTGFKAGDILTADSYTLDPNGITKWYKISKCVRNSVTIAIPNPVYASDGGSYKFLVVNYTVEDTFPTEIWISLSENGIRKKYILVN